MPSFQIKIAPQRRMAARFISCVRRELQKVFSEEKAKGGLKRRGINQSEIARELRGQSDLTLGRVAEIAYALGRVPMFSLVDEEIKLSPDSKKGLRAEIDKRAL